MITRTITYSMLIFVYSANPASAGWFGPKDYDECILENMKGVTVQSAVYAIKQSCRAKFPKVCHDWKKNTYAKWQTELDAYNKQTPPCTLKQGIKPTKTRCALNDRDCIQKSIESDPELSKTMCELRRSLNAPKEPPMPEGCDDFR